MRPEAAAMIRQEKIVLSLASRWGWNRPHPSSMTLHCTGGATPKGQRPSGFASSGQVRAKEATIHASTFWSA